jgi:CBS domain-containing protein
MLDVHTSLADKRVKDCMTSPVVSVGPDDTARDAAETMLRLHVSGVPVVDEQGHPLGVVSESDFRFKDVATREKQRGVWLQILSGGQDVANAYLDVIERQSETVRQIMVKPPICVDEATPIVEAADLMNEKRIRRLLVLRDGGLVGVVTRADLLRFFAPAKHVAKPVTPEFFEAVVEEAKSGKPKVEQPAPESEPEPGEITAAELKKFVNEYESKKGRASDEARRLGHAARDELVKQLLNARYTDPELQHLLAHAREAARRGETGIPALVFPSALCADGGRAINLPDPEWPATLRGKAADFFLRWDKELRPLGFGLTARIVNFPDGFPGDAELALAWGR